MRQINTEGLELVKRWEGVLDGDPTTVNLDPYLDPVGIWTIGWGHAVRDPVTQKFLRGTVSKARAFALYPDGITRLQAEDLLRADLLDAARDVSALVKTTLTDNQFSALVSFEFNTGGLAGSTLLKRLNVGRPDLTADEFKHWVMGTDNGKKVMLPGLVHRREEERELFLEKEK